MFYFYVLFSSFFYLRGKRKKKKSPKKKKEKHAIVSYALRAFLLRRASPHSYAGYCTSYTPAVQRCSHYYPERVRKHNSEGKRFGKAENIHSISRLKRICGRNERSEFRIARTETSTCTSITSDRFEPEQIQDRAL